MKTPVKLDIEAGAKWLLPAAKRWLEQAKRVMRTPLGAKVFDLPGGEKVTVQWRQGLDYVRISAGVLRLVDMNTGLFVLHSGNTLKYTNSVELVASAYADTIANHKGVSKLIIGSGLLALKTISSAIDGAYDAGSSVPATWFSPSTGELRIDNNRLAANNTTWNENLFLSYEDKFAAVSTNMQPAPIIDNACTTTNSGEVPGYAAAATTIISCPPEYKIASEVYNPDTGLEYVVDVWQKTNLFSLSAASQGNPDNPHDPACTYAEVPLYSQSGSAQYSRPIVGDAVDSYAEQTYSITQTVIANNCSGIPFIRFSGSEATAGGEYATSTVWNIDSLYGINATITRHGHGKIDIAASGHETVQLDFPAELLQAPPIVTAADSITNNWITYYADVPYLGQSVDISYGVYTGDYVAREEKHASEFSVGGYGIVVDGRSRKFALVKSLDGFSGAQSAYYDAILAGETDTSEQLFVLRSKYVVLYNNGVEDEKIDSAVMGSTVGWL